MIGLTLFLLFSILLTWCGTKLQVPLAKQVFVFLLILILGLRHDVGKDYPTYELIYNVPDSVQANATEPVWHLINYILRYLGFQARGFFFFTSVALMICFYKGIKSMSSNFYISVTLFVLSGFYFESANIVRQYVAIALLFYAFPYLLEGKIRKYMVWILLAALFHTSALLIFPFILLSRLRYPPILLFSALIISFLWGNSLLNILINYVMPSLATFNLYQYGVYLQASQKLSILPYFTEHGYHWYDFIQHILSVPTSKAIISLLLYIPNYTHPILCRIFQKEFTIYNDRDNLFSISVILTQGQCSHSIRF